MSGIDDIIKSLSEKHHSSLLGTPEAPEPVRPEPRARWSPPPPPSGAPKLYPSDRMMLRSGGAKPIPNRPPVNLFSYSDEELEWMFGVPVKRSYTFEDWLEVIGLPRDLHEKHDASAYSYAGRAFLRLKDKAHR